MLDDKGSAQDHRVLVEGGTLPRLRPAGGLCIWATLTRASSLLTRPTYSWMVFGGSPSASMRVGPAISSGMDLPRNQGGNRGRTGVQGKTRTLLTRGSPDATRSHDAPWCADAQTEPSGRPKAASSPVGTASRQRLSMLA